MGDNIKLQKLESLPSYDKIVRISELCPQRGLQSSQQLDEETMLKIVEITNYNTKLNYAQKANNEYKRMYFLIYGAIKYKGTNDIEEVKLFFELVEFIPEYSNVVKDDKGKLTIPQTIPPYINFLGIEYPVELSMINKQTILNDLNHNPEF